MALNESYAKFRVNSMPQMKNLLFSCLLLLETAAFLSAAVKHEFQLTLNYSMPFFNYQFQNDFQPHLLYSDPLSSSSKQTMNFQEQNQFLFSTAYNLFFSSRNGMQIKFNTGSGRLAGENPDVALRLDYIGHQPPAYEPREYHYQDVLAWPATEGKVRHTTISLNYLHSFQLHEAFQIRASAGFSLASQSLDFKYLAYPRFTLGGHSVLFVDTYMLEAFSKNFIQPGINGSLQLVIKLSSWISFLFDSEIVLTSLRAIALQISDQALLFPGDPMTLTRENLQEISKRMQFAPFKYNASRFSANFGLLIKLN
ncbi:MAG: hypothetical protein MUC72_00995 [Acidobacteria bacterium]|jgi:hypothetical protein|nr:hypothetical protein [Acidobacteriota bacterium]